MSNVEMGGEFGRVSGQTGKQDAIFGDARVAPTKAAYLAKLNESKSFLDRDTYQELLDKAQTTNDFGAFGALEKTLSDAKEGLGIFGVRRKNEEFAKLISQQPGIARQTVLSSGQNTTGVGSLGLFKQGS